MYVHNVIICELVYLATDNRKIALIYSAKIGYVLPYVPTAALIKVKPTQLKSTMVPSF